LIVGAAYLRNRNDVETPSSLKTVRLALAVVYFVCVAIEVRLLFCGASGGSWVERGRDRHGWLGAGASSRPDEQEPVHEDRC